MVVPAAESLQENLLALLVFDDEHGRLVHNLVDTSYFSDAYRLIAERASKYWNDYGQAPNRSHIFDLMEVELTDKSNRAKGATLDRILRGLAELSTSVNAQYVLDQANIFVRKQTISQAILDSAKLINQKQEQSLEEIEALWSRMLRTDSVGFQAGMRLTAFERVINFLDQQYKEFNTGIPVFDNNGIVPYRKSVFLFLASTGMGKSWWLVHLGKRALMLRKKVLHITLEMSEEEVAARYLQSMFSIGKRHGSVIVTNFDVDHKQRLQGFSLEEVMPEFSFDSRALSDELRIHLQAFGARIEGLLIKKFPMRALTPDGLRRYMDTLERVERFVPDIVLVDYLGIMKTDSKDHRISLGRTFEDLRGVADERNVPLGTAHQISRAGTKGKFASATDVAEDWSLIGTADRVVVMSRTNQEYRCKLARLFVDKARSDSDKFGILIAQNYKLGQFVTDSVMMEADYWDKLRDFDDENKNVTGTEDDNDEDDNDE